MLSMDLAKLNLIEKNLLQIREILNPEDSPYVCDLIVNNISDEDLEDLAMDMLIRMGYRNKTIIKIVAIIRKIQT
jgi:hypothetical protein